MCFLPLLLCFLFTQKLVNTPHIDDAFCISTGQTLDIQPQVLKSSKNGQENDQHHHQSLHHMNSNSSTNNTTASSLLSTDNYNLLDFDHTHINESKEEVAVAIPMIQSILSLNQNVSQSITPDKFQQVWSTTPEQYNGQIMMNLKTFPVHGTAEIEQLFQSHHIVNVASGSLPIGLKFFFYASGLLYDQENVEFFGQLIFTSQDITLIIKSNQNISASHEFVDYIKRLLCRYQ